MHSSATEIEQDGHLCPPPRQLRTVGLFTRSGSANEILIVRCPYEVDEWGLPGGSVQQGESPRDAMPRVTEQRLGLRMTAGRWLGVDFFPATDNAVEGVNMIFAGTVPDGALIDPGGGYTEYRFVTLQDAQYVLTGHAFRLFNECCRVRFITRIAELHAGSQVRY